MDRGGGGAKAAIYRARAGKRALARSATTEAVAQLTMGLEVLQGLPEDRERQRLELDLQVALGTALVAAKGPAAPEPARTYARARELCRQLGEERRLIPVLFGLWASYYVRDELSAARTVAAELLRLAEHGHDGVAGVLGHRALGTTLLMQGEFAASRTQLQRLLALDRSAAGPFLVAPFPFDPWVTGQAYLSLTLLLLGYPEQALTQADEALAEARRLAHHNSLALVLFCRCMLDQLVRDRNSFEAHSEALLTVAVEQGFTYWSAAGAIFRGWASVEGGKTAAGVAQMQAGLAAYRGTGAEAAVPHLLGLIADAHRRANDASQGQKLLAAALEHAVRTGEHVGEAELYRLQGELWLALPWRDPAGAEAAFRRAIEMARDQEAKWWELRAATSLARLWADQGERQKAHDLLAPVHGWFTEGFDTPDLKEAKALLEALI